MDFGSAAPHGARLSLCLCLRFMVRWQPTPALASLPGTVTYLSLTLAYCAPESAAAFERRCFTVTVHRELDTWALGVMAYELFTGSRLFGDSMTRIQARVGLGQRAWLCLLCPPSPHRLPPSPHRPPPLQILNVLRGRAPLPWESPGPHWDALGSRLGAMRSGVLAMLQRDASERTLLPDVYAQWMGLFGGSTEAHTSSVAETSTGPPSAPSMATPSAPSDAALSAPSVVTASVPGDPTAGTQSGVSWPYGTSSRN